MKRVYSQFRGFEHVYLEDSYVLDIQINPPSLDFLLLVVLTEQHALYIPPRPGQQYCYRTGLLRFPETERVKWLEKSMTPFTDATGAVDYGNIDEFYQTDDHYFLSGDWGRLTVQSAPPSLSVQDQLHATEDQNAANN